MNTTVNTLINDAKVGWKKFALHFFGFGIPVSIFVWLGGWSGALVLLAWRGYSEYEDYSSKSDTLGKAIIDFTAQVSMAVIVAIVRGFVFGWKFKI